MATTNIELNKETATLATEGTYCENDIKVSAKLQSKSVTPTTAAQTVEADEGYAGLKQVTVNPPQTETKTVAPSTSAQTVTPQADYFLSSVTVSAIPTETKTTTAGTAATTVNATDGKYMTSVTVNPTPSGSKTATANGTVTPDSGKLLSSVTVDVPPYAQDVATTAAMNANLVAANVGKIYRFTGTTDDSYTNGDLYIVEG